MSESNVKGEVIMAELINTEMLTRAVNELVSNEINDLLDIATDNAMDSIRNKIRERLAARIIGQVGTFYEMNYLRDRLVVSIDINKE